MHDKKAAEKAAARAGFRKVTGNAYRHSGAGWESSTHGRNDAPDALMSCRASIHFAHQGLPRRRPGRRPWRRVLPMPVRALDRVVQAGAAQASCGGAPGSPREDG
ncbi:hypothetical protein [Amycolatopsis sp. NPDC004625]|uniref:hypothetical protein n=1 Tax=Amycolatopsis sp. NPDC004625 TaxID=3154670 RepID=UPI0033AE442B